MGIAKILLRPQCIEFIGFSFKFFSGLLLNFELTILST
jgi:hypothetical protein